MSELLHDVMPDWLARQNELKPEQVAIEWNDGYITYAELYTQATEMAGWLRHVGFQKGTYVALLAKSGVKYAIAIHALMQLEAIVVPLNWRLTASEMAWQLDDASVQLVLADEALASAASAALAKAKTQPELLQLENVMAASAKAGRCLSRLHVQLQAVHAIIYTSGTTGHPKGAMISYGNEWWSATASALNFGLDTAEKWLVPMPLFHVGGLSVLMRSLIYGTTAYVQDGFDAKAVNEAIDKRRVTIVSVVPTMLQRMLEIRQGKHYPTSLRAVLLGGSAASKPLLEQAQALGVPVANSYGLTETASQFCTLDFAKGLQKLGSSGRPLLPNELRIEANSDAGVGEIIVRGPTVTVGYLGRPDATAAAIVDGWLHTGDVGYLDAEGYLYVVDRRKDLIVSGGENIYPAEIEAVLIQHPSVVDAAVVGCHDDEWGQVPVAFVVAGQESPNPAELPEPAKAAKAAELPESAEPLDTAGLQAYCRDHLARYKVPKRFVYVNELPRNASGKLLRRTLREWLENDLEPSITNPQFIR